MISRSVSLNGTVIDIANTMRLLGVSIDKDLNFNVHVKETIRKVSRKLQVLKRYKHLIPTHAKKRLYLAYFLPNLRGSSNTVNWSPVLSPCFPSENRTSSGTVV